MKQILLLLILFIISPLKANAICDYTQLAKLKKLASNITYTYDAVSIGHEGYENDVSFTITLLNLSPLFYIEDVSYGKKYNYNGSNEMIIDNYLHGETVTYNVYSVDDLDCAKAPLVTFYVNLPALNSYYLSPLCEGLSNYPLCQKWNKININYEEFEKQINDYKKSLIKEEEKPVEQEEKNETNINELIIAYVSKYYIYVLPAIILICSTWMIVLNKKNSFKF